MLELSFAWDDLPRIHLGVDAHRTRIRTEVWSVTLQDGREIKLDSLHQFMTYEGVLCGLPTHPYYNERPISAAIEKAKRIYKADEKTPWIVPPQMQRVTVVNRAQDEIERRTGHRPPERREVDFLPPVCSIGLFSSEMPTPKGNGHGSALIAIWFQDAFGLPDSYITERLRDLPWDSYSLNFSY